MKRDEWLKERMTGIGASECAAVLGLDPYRGPLDVYNNKIGIGGEQEETEAMKWGKRLEGAVAAEFGDRHLEYLVTDPGEFAIVRHPDLQFIFCTPDRLIDPTNGGNGVLRGGLQIKTTGSYAAKFWPTDNPPERFLVQCLHEMACNPGRPVWYLSALIGGNKYQEYRLGWDASLIAEIMRRLTAFWNDHVIARVPPPMDGTKAAERLLKHLYPESTEFVRAATQREAALLNEFAAARARYSGAEEAYDAVANRVKELIGTDAGLEWDGGRVLWKSTKGRRVIDYKDVVASLKEESPEVEALVKGAIATFTTTRPGSRRFTVNLNDGGDSDE